MTCSKEYYRKWAAEHPDNIDRNRANFLAHHPDFYKIQYQKRKANATASLKKLESDKEWVKGNKDKILQNRRNRTKYEVSSRIGANLRSRVLKAISACNNTKSESTIQLLGCSIDSFMIYIESLFEPGMSWGNRGYHGWHLHHIIPCAAFDLSRPDHQRACFHFSNLKPEWKNEHFKIPKSVNQTHLEAVTKLIGGKV